MDTLEKEIEELEWLSDKGCRFVSLADEDYPDLLRECPDRPLGIYFRSASSQRASASQVAVSERSLL